ncbi:MAG: EamA family transporter [Candidatus Woesearchaeota archaeon]
MNVTFLKLFIEKYFGVYKMVNWVFPLALLIVFELIADIFAKEWSLKQHTIWLAAASLGAYLIANTFWLFALKNGSGLAKGAMIFSISSAAIAIILGYFIYKESLTTMQLTGLGFGVISLVLLVGEF